MLCEVPVNTGDHWLHGDASTATNQSFTTIRDVLTVQEPQHIQSACVDWSLFCHRFGADVCLIGRSRRSRGWWKMTSHKMLEEGDSVMADRGFDVEDILAHKKVRLNFPPRLDGRPRLPEKDVEKTRRIAEVRIHVERSIGRARRYDILNSPIPLILAPIAKEIVSVCFLLTNLDKPLVQKESVALWHSQLLWFFLCKCKGILFA